MKKHGASTRPHRKKRVATPNKVKSNRTSKIRTSRTKAEQIECIFYGSGSGFGFARPTDISFSDGDLFIPPSMTGGAMSGDKILVRRILPGEHGFGKGNEGEVTEIISRGCEYITGIFYMIDGISYVIPDDKRIGQAVEIVYTHCEITEGDKVKLKITVYPDEYSTRSYVRRSRKTGHRRSVDACAAGEVVQNYGSADTKAANYEAILDMAGIPRHFSDEVLDEAEAVAKESLIADGRLDLRDQIIFTIDGADAKDLDDAISIRRDGDGYILGVHIADVSHYVKRGGTVDTEALARGTSVYFVDKVVPMLPEILSNGCCSLGADEDKYALSATIRLDKTGEIVSAEFAKSIIRSAVRGVYSEVNDILEHGASSAFAEKYSAVMPSLEIMAELYGILERRGRLRGALELDSDEAKIILDSEGFPVEIVPRERGTAERIIEQFMLRANVAAATFLKDSRRSGVYRIHESPSDEKMRSFGIFAHNMGLDVSSICKINGENAEARKNITPSSLSGILSEAKEKNLGEIVSGVMLRSLMKAKYSPMPSLHFGLAEELYCHFTSPIRRYPDLFVHRSITAAIEGASDIRGSAEAAERSTETEIRAVAAERAIEDLYMALYMSRRIGEEYDATVTSVTSFGIFARTASMCEGMIPIAEFGTSPVFNDKMLTLTARFGSKVRVFRLGDTVRIKVVSADVATGKISYSIVI